MPDFHLLGLPQLIQRRRATERALSQALASLEALRQQRPLPGQPPTPTHAAERKVKRLREEISALNDAIAWRERAPR